MLQRIISGKIYDIIKKILLIGKDEHYAGQNNSKAVE
jgi:hypothetical protein